MVKQPRCGAGVWLSGSLGIAAAGCAVLLARAIRRVYVLHVLLKYPPIASSPTEMSIPK